MWIAALIGFLVCIYWLIPESGPVDAVEINNEAIREARREANRAYTIKYSLWAIVCLVFGVDGYLEFNRDLRPEQEARLEYQVAPKPPAHPRHSHR